MALVRITWWEMKEFEGQKLQFALTVLDTIRCEWSRYSEAQVIFANPQSLSPPHRENMEVHLRSVQEALGECGLVTSAQAVEELRTTLINWKLPSMAHFTPSDVVARIDEIHRTITREMKTISFIYVPPDKVKWYENQPEEWKDARKRWPKITMDIAESARCFSFDRFAGAIFHILLVAEFGVIEVATMLGVAGDKPGWSCLEKLERILQKDYKDRSPLEQQHSELLRQTLPLMLTVKDSWRHKISHVENRLVWLDTDFSPQIAEEIIIATRGLMRRLALDLPR